MHARREREVVDREAEPPAAVPEREALDVEPVRRLARASARRAGRRLEPVRPVAAGVRCLRRQDPDPVTTNDTVRDADLGVLKFPKVVCCPRLKLWPVSRTVQPEFWEVDISVWVGWRVRFRL